MIRNSFRLHLPLILAGCMAASTLFGQTTKNLFTQQKSKDRLPSPAGAHEHIVDGSLTRSTVFQSAPLFKITKGKHRSVYARGSSVPVWIETKHSHTAATRMEMPDPENLCKEYLSSVADIIKIKSPSEEFDILSVKRNGGNLHIKLQQKYGGVPVHGSQIYIHYNSEATILNGRYIPTPFLFNTIPGIQSQNAITATINDLKRGMKYRDLTDYERKLLDYSGPETELVFYRKDIASDNVTLAWKVEIRPNPLDHWQYFIDASTGQIISKQNHTCTSGPSVTTATDLNGNTQTIHTYLSGSTYYLLDASKPMFNAGLSSMPDDPAGAIWTIDANNTDLTTFKQITSSDNSWTIKSAVSAHRNADSCYNYYSKVLSRNSLDGNGGTIISVINVTDGGQPMDNAYWNGKFMAYGNGDQLFKPLAGGLDVAAHEMTHGVIQNEANLNYQGESGAINESMADIFGCMVDRDDWHIGEDIMKSTGLGLFPSGYLRDLSDPHNGGSSSNDPCWQPKHMNEFVNTFSDNGGVHTNSGIPNYAFYLFSTAESKVIAEKVYYKALKDYLVASSQFVDLRLAVIQAANELYPNTTVASSAAAAFDDVGITDAPPTAHQSDFTPNPGKDYILVQGTDNVTDALNIINLSTSTITKISSTRARKKPSIPDDGSYAYFVNTQGKIVRKDLNNYPYPETIIDASRTWDNVAVSKDGLHLAAVTDQIDSSIFVGSSSGGSWVRFKLYSPTFTDGIATAGPQYADVLEWDYSGEKVMFDCYNLTVGSNQDTIDYWSIGFINVWDMINNTYGNGKVRNLFDGLPTYISIGNPTFAKNSPYIIAFDLLDYGAGELDIIGTNIETGDVGYILPGNSTLGFPSYSRLDDQVAFTRLTSAGDTAVYTIDLDIDKINYSSTGYLSGLDVNIKNPAWYATGSRVTGTTQASSAIADLNAYPNPFTDELNLDLTMTESGEVTIEVLDMTGRTVKTVDQGSEGSGLHNFRVQLNDIPMGTYMVKVKAGEHTGVAKIVKMR